VLLCQLLL